MSFSSIASMLSAAQESGQPLYAVIRDADCQENGYDAAASYRQIAALWTAMQQSSRQYCASDRSNSGLIGGDAARFRAAAEAGRLLGGTYFQRVTEEALKVAECNACMKRIVAAPTAGSCGVLPAVLIPLVEVRDVAEETILQALHPPLQKRDFFERVAAAVQTLKASLTLFLTVADGFTDTGAAGNDQTFDSFRMMRSQPQSYPPAEGVSDHVHLGERKFVQQQDNLLRIIRHAPGFRWIAAFPVSGKVYGKNGRAFGKTVFNKGKNGAVAAPAVQ